MNSKNGIRKLLIVTYEFPPLTTIGSRRWGEMVMYLRNYYNVFIYTTKSAGDFPVYISEKYIMRVGVFADNATSQRSVSMRSIIKDKFKKIISIFTKRMVTIDKTTFNWFLRYRGNFINFIKVIKPDIVISSSTPFSAHLYGNLAKHIDRDIIWIADVRDPISLNDRFTGHRFIWEKYLDQFIDRYCLAKADFIITNSQGYKKILEEFYKRKVVAVLYNGFLDYDNSKVDSKLIQSKNTILYYAGTFIKGREDSFRFLCSWIKSIPDVICKMRIKTSVNLINKLQHYLKDNKIQNVMILPPVGYKQIKEEERDADILISLDFFEYRDSISAGSIPGKIFEYLPLRAPILSLGRKNSEIAGILEKTKRGLVVSTKSEFLYALRNKEKFTLKNYNQIAEFSRLTQTRRLIEFIENLSLHLSFELENKENRTFNRKKRMAIICSTDYEKWPTGGMLSFLRDIIPYLEKYYILDLWGVRTDTMQSPKISISDTNYYIHYFAKINARSNKIIPNIIKVIWGITRDSHKILKENYDVLYFHGLPLEIPFVVIQRTRPFLISHIHGLVPFSFSFNQFRKCRIIDKIYDCFRKFVITRTRLTLLSTDSISYKQFVNQYNCRLKEKIVRVQNFANPQIFYPRDKVKIRQELGLPVKAKIIIFSGRLAYGKDPHLAISAFDILCKTGRYKYLLFLIAGTGDLFNVCKKFTCKIGLSNKIIFLGNLHREKLSKYLSASNIFLFTSRGEGTPISVIEAILCGLPIVTTKIAGVRDLVIHRYNGFIADNRESYDIAKLLDLALRYEMELAANSCKIASALKPEKVVALINKRIKLCSQ